jgi:hypothetical protein
MQTYNRKNVTVEARPYVGPKLTVVSSLKGEQIAFSGDYLVTDAAAVAAIRQREVTEGPLSPAGTIYVVPKAEFEAAFELAKAGDSEPAPPVPPVPPVPPAADPSANPAGTTID